MKTDKSLITYKKRFRPDRRGCIDCGELISRQSKWRCRDCHTKHMRTLIGERNSQYKELASSVAVNQTIKRRFGKAKHCTNINCDGYSTNYKWTRLKTKEGRKKGIWIELCNSCRARLQESYPTKTGIRNKIKG